MTDAGHDTLSLPRFPGAPGKNDGIFMFGAMRPKPYVYCYEQETTEVVFGPSCSIDREIDVRQCGFDGVPVVPRRSGGGTVVLSPGMVITVIVGNRLAGEPITGIFSRIHHAMIRLLAPLTPGAISLEGISDLAWNDRKIAGSSLYLPNSPPFYYYQSSIMVNSDTALIGRYLKHPPREPGYRKGRAHERFCTTFAQEGIPVSPQEIIGTFMAGLPSILPSIQPPAG